MNPRCRRLRREALRYVDDDLPLQQRLDYEQHLATCPACEQAVLQHRSLEESLLSMPRPLLSTEDQARLMAGIQGRAAPAPVERTAARWPRPLALAAAAVVGALGLWIAERSVMPPPPPPAEPAPPVAMAAPEPVVEEQPVVATTTLPALDPAVLEARRTLRRQVEEQLRRPPSGQEWKATDFLAASASFGSPRVLIQELERQLDHAEPLVACRAASILGQYAAGAATTPLSFSVVASLEREMRRPDRADAMLDALLAIDGDVARRALRSALEEPGLRERALLELVTREDPALRPTRERSLLTLLRSGQPDDRALISLALGRMTSTDAKDLRLLAELHDEGAPRPALQSALRHLGPTAAEALRRSLQGEGSLPDRTAVKLAGLSGDPQYAELLATCALRSWNSAEAIDALVEIGGISGLRQLLSLTSNPSCPLSRRALARDACVALLQRTSQRVPLAVWACTEAEDDARREQVLRVVAAVPGSTGNELLLSLAEERRLTDSARALASLHLALRVADSPEGNASAQALLDLLAREVHDSHATDGVGSPHFLASMLVSLYLVSDETGLQQGVQALGVDLTRRQEGTLLRLVRQATDRMFSTRYVACVDQIRELLASGP